MPLGLLGFEKVKNYHLLGSAEEAPFMWLQMADDLNLSFLVATPWQAVEFYQPEVSDEDAAFLNLEQPEDALVLNIVTLHGDGKATINLKSPLILNRHTLMGKQIIPRNVSSFGLQHPLNVMEN